MISSGFPKYREHVPFQMAVLYQILSSRVQAIRLEAKPPLVMLALMFSFLFFLYASITYSCSIG